jgi:Holliday junction DNA helicase RuvA
VIAGIEGQLVELGEETALVKVGAVTYEVMLPGYCIAALSGQIGAMISLYTTEYYEGSLGGGNLIPRMIGFLSPLEREFFSEFTSVKGLGIRKGLRALSLPIADVAAAVETGDEKMLMTLSGIGRKMAQAIVAELKGKLQGFAFGAQTARGVVQTKLKPFQTEAIEILIAWGEKRNEAIELVEQACQKHPEIGTAEELVPVVYRVKQGAEA